MFGDIIFVKGNSIFSKIIKWVTKSEYTHCAIVVSDDNLHIAEINYKYNLKINHLHYKDYVICRYKYDLTQEQKEKIYNFILNTLNTKYDYIQTIGHLLRKLFGFKIINNPYMYNCSEFCDKFYKSADINLLENDYEGSVTPGELFRSEILIKIE